MEKTSFPDFLKDWNEQQNQTTPEIHLKLALWLEQKWLRGDARLLVMAFRGFGKSSVVGVFCTWLLYRNPDLRILVLAADLALARKMVRQVKRIIEKHPLTKELKPTRIDQWADERFTLKRTLELRDPSMLAKGITTNLTGARADVIICDDVEVPKTSNTAYKREELRERLLELDFILTPDGAMIYVGTPHHYNTIYADELRQGEERIFLTGYERTVTPVLNEAGESAWPERFSLEKIEAHKAQSGPAKFMSQMMCEPTSYTDGRFSTEHIDIYDDELSYNESSRQPVLTIGKRKMVTGVAWWDPAYGSEKGDHSVVAVVFKDTQGHHWLHHVQAVRVNPHSVISEMDQQCAQVAKILEDHFAPNIMVETNGIGMFLPGHLRKYLRDHSISSRVDDIASTQAKNTRIFEGFESTISARTLHVHRSTVSNGFLRQLQEWIPTKKGQRDDILDAVAGAITAQKVNVKSGGFVKNLGWQGNGKTRVVKTILD